MKTYILMLAKNYLAEHPKKGKATSFETKVRNAIAVANGKARLEGDFPTALKYHTCREDYFKWKKIFDEILRGDACLSIRQWEGLPRRSKAIEILRLTKDNCIGLQRLDFVFDKSGKSYITMIDNKVIPVDKIANNDGLTLPDWQAWFKKADLTQPMAVIQFTQFRY